MDLEFLGRNDLGGLFLDEYGRLAGDSAPLALKDFYIAYRAAVRAKVDCIRVAQGHPDARADARRHIDIALDHLRAADVRVILVGGGWTVQRRHRSHVATPWLAPRIFF